MSTKKANPKASVSFVLASGSPRRRELLKELLDGFEVVTTDAEELSDHPLGPEALVRENARRKAISVAGLRPESWVLGADTVVSIGDRILGKPADLDEATSMLRLLSGRTHRVCTGLCLKRVDSDYEDLKVDSSEVSFQSLCDERIESYFSEVNPLDKAGGYAIQTRPDLIVSGFSGSRSNVIGLPLEMLEDWLREVGVL